MERRLFLACGIASAIVYPATDILAGRSYPGYSFMAQAVSELFAIGAPTARPVVALFSVSSVLLALFAIGVWQSAGTSRALHVMAFMFLGNAIDSLVLWNFFPMHMRGEAPGFTDQMHAILAINPFVLLSIVCAAVAFRNWFRFHSIATIVMLIVMAALGFSYIPQVIANQPTPWLGLTERAAQYAAALWQATLAIVLVSVQRLEVVRVLRRTPVRV